MIRAHATPDHKPSLDSGENFSPTKAHIRMDVARQAFLQTYLDWLLTDFPDQSAVDAETSGTLLCLQQVETLLRRGGIIHGR